MSSVLATKTKQRDTRQLWKALDMPVTLVVGMVPPVFAHVRTHRIVHANVCRSGYISKALVRLFLKTLVGPHRRALRSWFLES